MAGMEREEFNPETYDIYAHRTNKLALLSKMEEWEIKQGEPDIRGWTVRDRNGQNFGKTDDLIVDTDSRVIPFAEINYDQLLGVGGKHRLAPLDKLEIDTINQIVTFDGTKEDLDQSPDFTKDESDFGKYYNYWSSKRGAAAVEEERAYAQKGGEAKFTEEEGRADIGKSDEPPAQHNNGW